MDQDLKAGEEPIDPDVEFDKWCTSKGLDIEKMRNSSHGAMWAIVAFKDALTLQRPAPQPAREPLTDAAIMDAYCKAPDIRQYVTAFKAGARFAEQHHGITAKP